MDSRSIVLMILAIVVALQFPLLADDQNIATDSFNEIFLPIDQGSSQADTVYASGDLAEGWQQNPGERHVTFSRDSDGAKDGGADQKMTISDSGTGAVELGKVLASPTPGSYRFQIWLKADTNQSGKLIVRQGNDLKDVVATHNIDLTPEWASYDVEASLSSPQVYFALSFSVKGTVWIDDFSVTKANAVPGLVEQQREGNLLDDTSFETGLGYGWRLWLRNGDNLALALKHEAENVVCTQDTSDAFAGKSSLKFAVPFGRSALLTSAPVMVSKDDNYVASIAVKSDSNAHAELSILGDDGKPLQTTTLSDSGPKWSRMEVTTHVPAGSQIRLSLRLYGNDSQVSAWVDAAQLEEGQHATPYNSAYSTELNLAVTNPGGIYFPDEPIVLKVFTGGDIPQKTRLQAKIESLMGTTEALPDLAVPTTEWTISPDITRPFGLYKVTAQLVDSAGNAISAPCKKIFARLPHPRNINPEESYFGAHADLQPDELAIVKALGIHWLRLHDTSGATIWANIEKTEGTYDFHDEGVDNAVSSGFCILGMLDTAPRWATSKPAQQNSGYFSVYNVPDNDANLNKWSEYVAQTILHFKGRIKYWEVWNEPFLSKFFPGTAEQYATILKTTYDKAKKASPECIIVGPCTAPHKADWTKEVLTACGCLPFDIFSYHDYNPSLYSGDPSNPERITSRFTKIQEQYGSAKTYWETEGGAGNISSWYGNDEKYPAGRKQMAHLVHFDVTQMAAGVKKYFFYTLGGNQAMGASGYRGLEYDNSIMPAMAGSAVLASLVDGAIYQGRVKLADGIDAFAFLQQGGEKINVLWSRNGTPITLSIPSNTKALDMFGNEIEAQQLSINDEPVYFIQK